MMINNKTVPLNNIYYNSTAVWNMFLIAAAIFILIYYVVISNTITASRFKISLLNNELTELIEKNGVLTAQKLVIEDSSAIINFAQSHNMTEARHVTHIFESSDVALQN